MDRTIDTFDDYFEMKDRMDDFKNRVLAVFDSLQHVCEFDWTRPRDIGKICIVNYSQPKGSELVMLPMLPWQAYSTIGWLTCTLPSRFSEYRLAAS